jgi:hypothetical protein
VRTLPLSGGRPFARLEGPSVRLLLVVLLALSFSTSALAQEAPPANETPANETPAEGSETPAEGEPAAPAGPIEIILEGVQEGSALYFRIPGETQRNPTLTVQPGQVVKFTLRVTSGVHNLNVGGAAKTPILSEGEEASFEWTAPTEPGVVEYWCDPHKTAGMRGRIQVGAAAPAGGGEEGQISGDTIDLGQYSAACAGKKAPAAAAEGIVGLPTLQDYIDQCSAAQGEVNEPVREKHVADYIIPLSWLLIGVGIVGVVWVHKYYKP